MARTSGGRLDAECSPRRSVRRGINSAPFSCLPERDRFRFKPHRGPRCSLVNSCMGRNETGCSKKAFRERTSLDKRCALLATRRPRSHRKLRPLCGCSAEGKGGGIGPAYFTKLIFFANPRHDGYIMDQWTSRSVNLLVDGPAVVKMRTLDHVDPRNSSQNFERFCKVVEAISTQLLNRTPEETEQCLFSTGGKKPAAWRRYLVQHGG